MNFGDFLKIKREVKGISKYQLSKMTGIAITTLSDYESLKHEPRISNAKKICQALNEVFVIEGRWANACYWDVNRGRGFA